jgi:hypothetical protein
MTARARPSRHAGNVEVVDLALPWRIANADLHSVELAQGRVD